MKARILSKKIAIRSFLGVGLILLLLIPSAFAKESGAAYTQSCTFATSNSRSPDRLHDGNYRTCWYTEGDYGIVDIETPEGASGIYVAWAYQPTCWWLFGSDDREGWTEIAEISGQQFMQQYVPVECYRYYQIRLPELDGERYGISEIMLHTGSQEPPEEMHIWQPTVESAELMVISAHSDDETVFFGGVLPYYSAQREKDTVVLFMAAQRYYRRHEALNALWASGVRTYPVFAPFEDEYSETLKDAARFWGGRDEVVSYLVNQIRAFKPQVIVTHDLEGEYGHGAHRLTADAIMQAVEDAEEPAIHPQSAKEYGTWQTPKLYLHLYDDNPIVMTCFDEPLEAFNGKSAIEVAKEALLCHESQLKWQVVRVHERGAYNCRKYGLAYSQVGTGTVADFFEGIPTPTPVPTATPEPTAIPTPEPTPSPTVSPAPSASPAPQPIEKGSGWQRFVSWILRLLGFDR